MINLLMDSKLKRLQKELALSLSKGFTLIELLVVIAVLGVLAAGVVVAINPAKRIKQANDTKIKNDIDQILIAFQTYYTTSGSAVQSYPTALTDVGPTGTGDLKIIPIPPSCSSTAAYQVVTSITGCLPATAICNAAVYAALCDTAVGSELWCWQSSTGVAKIVATGACTAP